MSHYTPEGKYLRCNQIWSSIFTGAMLILLRDMALQLLDVASSDWVVAKVFGCHYLIFDGLWPAFP